jgi:RNA polymerase sigma-70 factor (ECF subfamily)
MLGGHVVTELRSRGHEVRVLSRQAGGRVTGRPGPGAEELARAFQAQRPRLVRLAYATTSSLAEAEDCVQEAWLRLRRVPDPGSIRDLGAWLTITVSRLALDSLGSARARRERYVGPWLPEPLVSDLGGSDPGGPGHAG